MKLDKLIDKLRGLTKIALGEFGKGRKVKARQPLPQESPSHARGREAAIENSDRLKALLEYLKFELAKEKAKSKLEFTCPRCSRSVKPRRDSRMLRTFLAGEVSAEEARRALMVAHYRHEHTPYEEEMRRLDERKYGYYREYRDTGFNPRDAWSAADWDLFDEEVRLRRRFNEMAIRLLKEDGLLK